MTDETSIDLAGIGKVAKAIPPKAWVQIVDTACVSFRELMAPLTATTSGIGRLIESKFDRLIDAERVLAAETVQKALDKVSRKKSTGMPTIKSARVVIAVLEKSSIETDPVLRELWANLLATEFSSGEVHPEFPVVLGKLSSQDAQVLAQVAQSSMARNTQLFRVVNDLLSAFKLMGVQLRFREERTYIHEHLENLKLIDVDRSTFALTLFGQEFLKAVAGDGKDDA
jgi:hypothetical protein